MNGTAFPQEFEETLVCATFGLSWSELEEQPAFWYSQALSFALIRLTVERERARHT